MTSTAATPADFAPMGAYYQTIQDGYLLSGRTAAAEAAALAVTATRARYDLTTGKAL